MTSSGTLETAIAGRWSSPATWASSPFGVLRAVCRLWPHILQVTRTSVPRCGETSWSPASSSRRRTPS
eukprot:12735183-Alexandrium_andersonii.AAC.1